MDYTYKVNMLGRFTVWSEATGLVELSLTGRSKKLWTMVAYLIIHRSRGVPAAELIENFFPGSESDNPLSTLQNNVSRARTGLEKLGFPDVKELISFRDGLYKWTPPTETDFEIFDSKVTELESISDGDFNPDEGLEAISLYAGDFLSEITAERWAMSYNTYYHEEYLRICVSTAEKLIERGRYGEAEDLCTKVFATNPMEERISTALMHSMTMNGKPQKALEVYMKLCKLYDSDYGVIPSSVIELERTAAEHEMYNGKVNSEDFAELLKGLESGRGAFMCDSSTFCRIVNLHLREYARSQAQGQIILMHIGKLWMTPERQAILMKQVESVLHSSLRSGDPFSVIGAKQIAILLPGASENNVPTVVERIFKRFSEDYPSQPLDFAINNISLARLSELRKQRGIS